MKLTEKEMAAALKESGWGVIPPDQFMIDMEAGFRKIWKAVQPFTMTSVERGYSLYKTAGHLAEAKKAGRKIGDFVECGVWKGGSCMLMALALIECGITDVDIHLYDTFEGMTEPGSNDFIAWNGRSVQEKWESDQKGLTHNFTGWAVSLEQVKENILGTGYPEERLHFIKGPVEQTLGTSKPERISLLRLDTDWYESTKTELEQLWPLLDVEGVLIIDDYGHFTGARKAVDEFFSGRSWPLLNRIDYTGRIAVKTEQ